MLVQDGLRNVLISPRANGQEPKPQNRLGQRVPLAGARSEVGARWLCVAVVADGLRATQSALRLSSYMHFHHIGVALPVCWHR